MAAAAIIRDIGVTFRYTAAMAKQLGSNAPNISEIDDDIADVCGKRVYYQLTDEEGGTDEPGGRKRAAVTTHIYHDGRRDPQGRKLTGIFVFAGGGFEKDAPLDSSRQPGTWDIFHSGDIAS